MLSKDRKEHILFVDDENILVELENQRLSKLGYKVVTATSGIDALNIFRKEPDKFNLVITDYAMPYFTGLDLAEELLKVKATVPIILCTGHSENVSGQRAREAGIKAFLVKPVGKRQMVETIRRLLDLKTDEC